MKHQTVDEWAVAEDPCSELVLLAFRRKRPPYPVLVLTPKGAERLAKVLNETAAGLRKARA